MKKLAPKTASALRDSTTEQRGDQFFLTLNGKVAPSLYAKVKEALAVIGGPWLTNKQAHVFNYNPAPLLAHVMASGELPDANPGDFFPTPSSVVDQMIEAVSGQLEHILYCIETGEDVNILEPSGGVGGIVQRILKRYPKLAGHITIVEQDPIKCEILRALNADPVINADFLTWETETRFALCIMNPPFSKPRKNIYVEHVTRAYDLLTNCGTLCAITPTNWLDGSDKTLDGLHDMVANHGEYVRLRDKAFAESGTLVKTAMLTLDHSKQGDRRVGLDGYSSNHAMHISLCVENNSSFTELTRGAEPSLEEIIEVARQAIPSLMLEDHPFPRDPAILEAAAQDLLASIRVVIAENNSFAAAVAAPAAAKAPAQKVVAPKATPKARPATLRTAPAPKARELVGAGAAGRFEQLDLFS